MDDGVRGSFSRWGSNLDRRRRRHGSGPENGVIFPSPPPRNSGVRLGRRGRGTGVDVVGHGTTEDGASADNGGAVGSGRDAELLDIVFVGFATAEPSVKGSCHRFVVNAKL